MKFNILKENWIPVRTSDGKIVGKSVEKLLLDAHSDIEITDPNPSVEYGIYRFLFTLLMDIFRPKDRKEIKALLKKNKFDDSLLYKYEAKCLGEGVSFDIFDKQRPFFQVGLDQWTNKDKPSSIARLDPRMPSGNNHIFFESTLEDDEKLSVVDAVKLLIAHGPSCTMGGAGYSPSINGAPPVYTIIRGGNLFETLVYGMVPEEDVPMRYADPLPFWRWNPDFKEKPEFERISLLGGLTFPTRKMRLVSPKEDGVINQIYYKPGFKIKDKDLFKDPYVTYVNTKAGDLALKPRLDVELWRNLGLMLDIKSSAPQVVKQYNDISDSKTIRITAYSIFTDQAKFLDMDLDEFEIDKDIIFDEAKATVLNKAIQAMNDHNYALKTEIVKIIKEVSRDPEAGITAKRKEEVLSSFYGECKDLVFAELLPELGKAAKKKTGEVYDSYIAKLADITLDSFEEFQAHIEDDTRLLDAAMNHIGLLQKKIEKLGKAEDENADEDMNNKKKDSSKNKKKKNSKEGDE